MGGTGSKAEEDNLASSDCLSDDKKVISNIASSVYIGEEVAGQK